MKLFTIVISNNSSEAKTNQQRHYEKNKKSIQKKVNSTMKKTRGYKSG